MKSNLDEIMSAPLSAKRTQKLLRIAEDALLADELKRHLQNLLPGRGMAIGPFTLKAEAEISRKKVRGLARTIRNEKNKNWYEAYGQRTKKGGWSPPYRADVIQIRDLTDEEDITPWLAYSGDAYLLLVARYATPKYEPVPIVTPPEAFIEKVNGRS